MYWWCLKESEKWGRSYLFQGKTLQSDGKKVETANEASSEKKKIQRWTIWNCGKNSFCLWWAVLSAQAIYPCLGREHMQNAFSRYDQLREQWECFQRGQEVDASIIRPEILNSWRRCRAAGIPADKVAPSRFLGPSREMSEECKELLEVAVPLMEKFITSIKKGKCVISLYDASGFFL